MTEPRKTVPPTPSTKQPEPTDNTKPGGNGNDSANARKRIWGESAAALQLDELPYADRAAPPK